MVGWQEEGGIVCELHACLSESVTARERERQREEGATQRIEGVNLS